MTGPESPEPVEPGTGARSEHGPAALDLITARRRFLVLTALRWFPVGLTIPVTVLLPVSRGLSLSQVGLAMAMQGVVVLLLELPTGALADTVGRRRLLLLAGVFGLASTSLILTSHSLVWYAVAWALQGVFRALDSGPLEAWFVDAALSADPRARLERSLSAQGVVLGIAIGAGSLVSGAVIAWAPHGRLEPMAVPVACALALQVVSLVAIGTLMVDHAPHGGLAGAWRGVTGAPGAVRDGIGLVRADRVLRCIVLVELLWGFGMVAFEQLTPVRLAQLVGDADAAAAITGPAAAVAWLASAGGAAILPACGTRWGVARTAMALRLVQGATIVGIGFATGVVGALTAYLACYTVHGASNPAHLTLLHGRVTGERRATVLSVNSMVGQPGSIVGTVLLTWLADRTSVGLACLVAAVVLASAAPLYLPAWRVERAERAHAATVG